MSEGFGDEIAVVDGRDPSPQRRCAVNEALPEVADGGELIECFQTLLFRNCGRDDPYEDFRWNVPMDRKLRIPPAAAVGDVIIESFLE